MWWTARGNWHLVCHQPPIQGVRQCQTSYTLCYTIPSIWSMSKKQLGHKCRDFRDIMGIIWVFWNHPAVLIFWAKIKMTTTMCIEPISQRQSNWKHYRMTTPRQYVGCDGDTFTIFSQCFMANTGETWGKWQTTSNHHVYRISISTPNQSTTHYRWLQNNNP